MCHSFLHVNASYLHTSPLSSSSLVSNMYNVELLVPPRTPLWRRSRSAGYQSQITTRMERGTECAKSSRADGGDKKQKRWIGRTRLSSPTAHSIRQKEKDIVLDRSGTSFTADQCAVACSSHIDVYDSRGFVRSASPALLTISNRWTRRATDPIREKTERNQGRGRRKERIDTFGKLDSVVDDYGLSTPFSFPRWFFSAGL